MSQFNEEALVSDGELRIEVAMAVVRSVGGDETVLLKGDRNSHFWQDVQMIRGRRTRTVRGDYHRRSVRSDLTMLDGKPGDYFEVVANGADQHATVEAESIVGGAYNANYVGPFMRMTAFSDFMVWGGWAEADVTRVEVCVMAIRAYMGYAHAAGVRVQMAGQLFDDWVKRTETFGSLVDQQGDAIVLGGPGAVTHNEA